MNLTKYPAGSVRELWTISYPLMLTSLSIFTMLFVDRLFLANFATAAHNAVVGAMTLGWVFVIFWMNCANISEVFVAQFNGADLKHRLGEPVWQMLWLALGTSLFFLPMAVWGPDLFFGDGPHDGYAREYFYWMMLFGPVSAMFGALAGFFIGQGKTMIVTLVVFVANVLNILLDAVLIFGYEPWVPAMGVKGAAIATSSSVVMEVLVLFFLFIRKKNRDEHGTGDYRYHPATMLKCLRIGLPSAFCSGFEILGWAAFYWMMMHVSEKHITIAGICQSFILFFYFVVEGLNKGIVTVAGNLIGSKRVDLVPKVLRSGVRFCTLFLAGLILLYGLGVELAVTHFLPFDETTDLRASLRFCLMLSVGYLFVEAIRFAIYGALTAAGDTLFLMGANALAIWLFVVMPVFYLIMQRGGSIELAMTITVLGNIAAVGLNLWRYFAGSWRSIVLVPE